MYFFYTEHLGALYVLVMILCSFDIIPSKGYYSVMSSESPPTGGIESGDSTPRRNSNYRSLFFSPVLCLYSMPQIINIVIFNLEFTIIP